MWPLKSQPKPSECADHMLRALVKAYDDPRDDKARVQGLDVTDMARRAQAWDPLTEPLAPILDAKDRLLERGHIFLAGHHLTYPMYKPTAEGVAYAKERFVPLPARALRLVGRVVERRLGG